MTEGNHVNWSCGWGCSAPHIILWVRVSLFCAMPLKYVAPNYLQLSCSWACRVILSNQARWTDRQDILGFVWTELAGGTSQRRYDKRSIFEAVHTNQKTPDKRPLVIGSPYHNIPLTPLTSPTLIPFVQSRVQMESRFARRSPFSMKLAVQNDSSKGHHSLSLTPIECDIHLLCDHENITCHLKVPHVGPNMLKSRLFRTLCRGEPFPCERSTVMPKCHNDLGKIFKVKPAQHQVGRMFR